jgi:hypothetical protein
VDYFLQQNQNYEQKENHLQRNIKAAATPPPPTTTTKQSKEQVPQPQQ